MLKYVVFNKQRNTNALVFCDQKESDILRMLMVLMACLGLACRENNTFSATQGISMKSFVAIPASAVISLRLRVFA